MLLKYLYIELLNSITTPKVQSQYITLFYPIREKKGKTNNEPVSGRGQS